MTVTLFDGKHKRYDILFYHEIIPLFEITLYNQIKTLLLPDYTDDINSSPKTAPTWKSNKRIPTRKYKIKCSDTPFQIFMLV
jgi:hypothetical protein